jgi:hypothetical protein
MQGERRKYHGGTGNTGEGFSDRLDRIGREDIISRAGPPSFPPIKHYIL